MDAGHSFDSDTSESWSLIDACDNDNSPEHEIGEGVDATILIVPEDISNGTINLVPDVSFQKYEEIEQNGQSLDELNESVNSSLEKHLKTSQDFHVLYKGKVFQEDDLGRRSSDLNFSKSSVSEGEKVELESRFRDVDNDTDSISIISESECNFKSSPYETDEISEEKGFECHYVEKTYPNVLKRKRKRLKLNYRESSEESISSDFMVPEVKYYSSIDNADFKRCDNVMQVKEYPSTPVYRHYRNNVANTVLSLAVGVIFTGVACVAIGHFLGVHDAQNTASEMMATLKRLQMENVLLHTRLAQLSRAFFSRGNNEVGFRSRNKPQNCDRCLEIQQTSCNVNENFKESGEMMHSMIFHDRHFEFPTATKSEGNELPYKPNGSNKNPGQFHDQSNFMNVSKYDGDYYKVSHSSTIPIRTEVLRRSVVHENQFNLDSPESDKKSLKPISMSPIGDSVEYFNIKEAERTGSQQEVCLAVRERDLNRFRWFLQKKRKRKNLFPKNCHIDCENGKSVYLYKFPQPEEYYKYENKPDSIKLRHIEDNSKSFNITIIENKEPNRYSAFSKNSTEYNHSVYKIKKMVRYRKDDYKSREYVSAKVKEYEFKRKQKTKVWNGYGEERLAGKNREKDRAKRKSKSKESKGKITDGREKESKRNTSEGKKKRKKEHSFLKNDNNRSGGNLKNHKRRKSINDALAHMSDRAINFKSKKPRSHMVQHSKGSFNQTHSVECSNTSGFWLYRWAKGREKCRRNHRISEWGWERAKSRANSRTGDAYWQFNRALGRESSRKEESPTFY